MPVLKPSPKCCASMRIAVPQARAEVLSRYRAAADKERHKTGIIPLQLRIILDKAYLDGLRGLAFNLMRYSGGLVHLGTPARVVLLSRWHKPAEERSKASPVSNSTAWDAHCLRSSFGVRLRRATASDSYCRCLARRSPAQPSAAQRAMCTNDR